MKDKVELNGYARYRWNEDRCSGSEVSVQILETDNQKSQKPKIEVVPPQMALLNVLYM